MVLKYNATNLAFVNTSEAYSNPIFIGNNNIIIPYINVGIMPDNPITGVQSVIDFGYLVFKHVVSVIFESPKGELTFGFNSEMEKNYVTKYIGVGGYRSHVEAELKIDCTEIFFYILENATVNSPSTPFIPIDTPNFKRNMDVKQVNSFFLLINLPEEIKEVLGSPSYSISLGDL
jgi:hypothetical protein